MSTVNIGVVIVNRNRGLVTSQCIESVLKAALKGIKPEIVVVDNASSDHSNRLISQKFPGITTIENKTNLGFAEGNNVGISRLIAQGADRIMLLNNDTIVDKNIFSVLDGALNAVPANGIVAPKIYFAPGCEYHRSRYPKHDLGKVIWYAGGQIDWANVAGVHRGLDQVDNGQFDEVQETEYASGCCMMVKSSVFKKSGMFDERYFLYLEDMDFCVRARKSGFKIIYVPKAVVWHKNLGTNQKSVDSLQSYYYTRNRLLFGFSRVPLRTKIALARESLRYLIKGTYWQKKGVIDFYIHKYGTGSFPPVAE